VDDIVGQLLGCVEEVWPHTAVVGGRVMLLGVIIGKIVCSGPPVDQELPLAGPVLDPVESHVDGLGSFLFDGVVGESFGSGVMDLHWGWRLRMTHLFERCPNGDGFLSVHVGGCNLCFDS
jgi:hypothetical protein